MDLKCDLEGEDGKRSEAGAEYGVRDYYYEENKGNEITMK